MPPKKHPQNLPENTAAAALEPYEAKRDFTVTPEPAPAPAGEEEGSLFVIQEHHARRHHYDLRLEVDGVLKSWAVPKEPTLDPAVKRLAVEVEDHPLQYASFEGAIPSAQYGAGQVRIWDVGTWEPVDNRPKEALAKGKLKFELHGTRMHGRFLLTRLSGSDDEKNNWLLRKIDDLPPARPPRASRSTTAPMARKVAKPQAKPAPATLPSPQLAKLIAAVPRGADWLHELKFDGYRILAAKRRGKLTLVTRSGLDWTHRFGDLAAHIDALSPEDFLIDGEVVAFDTQQRSDFSRLQSALKTGRTEKLVFVAFDLLDHGDTDLSTQPLIERKTHLCKLLQEDSRRIRFSHHWRGHAAGRQLFEQACELKLEGIMSKPAADPYLPGSRQGWRKIKCVLREEFIVCGFTPPKGSNSGFGALVLGSYEHGQLTYRGKVGTGFSEDRRLSLLKEMHPLQVKSCPFPDDPGERPVTWLRPELVAEINFAELTADGRIRHGSFIALREDKLPSDVHMEARSDNPPEEKSPGAKEKSAKPGDEDRVAGVVISHPYRLLYPGTEITKHDVAAYYSRVAPLILPHLVGRPLSFLRAPSGIAGQIFFQKHFATRLPAGVKAKPLDPADPESSVCYLTHEKGLISLVQNGVIEFHPWGANLAKPDQPDMLVWDLDPGYNMPWEEVLGTAFLLRDLLRERGLHPVVKTSGGKGLHIQIFLTPEHHWDVLKPFTKAIATLLAQQNPQRLTTQASKSERTGKMYIDYLRNGRGATCVAPWSLRARPGATVSLPTDWAHLPTLNPANLTLPNIEPAIPLEWANALASRDSIPITLLKELGIKSSR